MKQKFDYCITRLNQLEIWGDPSKWAEKMDNNPDLPNVIQTINDLDGVIVELYPPFSSADSIYSSVIHPVTTIKSGVMLPADKISLDKLKSWASSGFDIATNCFDTYVNISVANPFSDTSYDTEIPEATTIDAGVMSAKDKQTLNDIASFKKSTTNPLASHPFVCDYCDLMDVDIVMTVGDTNLWCAKVLLNDTEDQTYVATYNGEVLLRKPYRYQYPNTPQGDITTWFISLPKTAARGSCIIGVG